MIPYPIRWKFSWGMESMEFANSNKTLWSTFDGQVGERLKHGSWCLAKSVLLGNISQFKTNIQCISKFRAINLLNIHMLVENWVRNITTFFLALLIKELLRFLEKVSCNHPFINNFPDFRWISMNVGEIDVSLIEVCIFQLNFKDHTSLEEVGF